MSYRFQTWVGCLFWGCSGLFVSLVAFCSATQLYYYFFSPFSTGDPYADSYISVSVFHTVQVGPIVLEDREILVVFGLLFATSLALVAYSFSQLLRVGKQTNRTDD